MPSSNKSKIEKNYRDRVYCFICNINRENQCKEVTLIPFTMILDHYALKIFLQIIRKKKSF